MTPDQIEMLQKTFAVVELISDQAAELFYGRLFELDPSLRPMFRGDMVEQGRKLMQTIAVVVKNADRLETLLPAVQALGRRHVAYGVRDEYYATVASALLWTLEQGLGAAFTPEVREAWTTAYNALASVMQDAAADEIADGMALAAG
jgi:nitric oxide dioxygenase